MLLFIAISFLLLLVICLSRFLEPPTMVGGELICASGYNNPACGTYVPYGTSK